MAEWKQADGGVPADLINFDPTRWETESLSDEDRATMTPRDIATWHWVHDSDDFDRYRDALIAAVGVDEGNAHAAHVNIARLRVRLLAEDAERIRGESKVPNQPRKRIPQ